MRTRLACGLRLLTNVSPQPPLTRFPRAIRAQLRWRPRNRGLRLIAVLLATLPAIGFSQFTTQMTGQINTQSATTSSAPETTAPPASSSGTTNSSSAALATAINAPPGYQLSANDGIAVEVFGEEDLKTTARLNSEGNASLPLLGSVHLAGLTLTQATTRVTELYGRDYLVSPKVNVSFGQRIGTDNAGQCKTSRARSDRKFPGTRRRQHHGWGKYLLIQQPSFARAFQPQKMCDSACASSLASATFDLFK